MYYICKKKENIMGVRFGIMDTEDGVVEYYSPRDIIEFVKERGFHIEGVQLNRDTGKWTFKVLKPTAFTEAETTSYSANPKVVKGNTAVSEISHKQLKDTIEVSYPKDWGMLDDLTEGQIEEIFKPWKAYLDVILYCLGIQNRSYLDFIDGCDCVGYYKLAIPNTPYFMSIYTNPSYASKYTGKNIPSGVVILKGLGVDIDGVEGKSVDECHFDSPMCDDFAAKLKAWLNKFRNTVSSEEITKFISLCKYAEKLLPRCKPLNYTVSLHHTECDDYPTLLEGGLNELQSFDFCSTSEVTLVESYFAAAADCGTDWDDTGYFYVQYNPSKDEYSLYADDLHEEAIRSFEYAGFPKGEFQKHFSDGIRYYEVKGTYEEMLQYINNLLGCRDIEITFPVESGTLADVLRTKNVLARDFIGESIKDYVAEMIKKLNSGFSVTYCSFGDQFDEDKYDYMIHCSLPNCGLEFDFNCIVLDVEEGLVQLQREVGLDVLGLSNDDCHFDVVLLNESSICDARTWLHKLLLLSHDEPITISHDYLPIRQLHELGKLLLDKRVCDFSYSSCLHQYILEREFTTYLISDFGMDIDYLSRDNYRTDKSCTISMKNVEKSEADLLMFVVYPDYESRDFKDSKYYTEAYFLTICYNLISNKFRIKLYSTTKEIFIDIFDLEDLLEVEYSYTDLRNKINSLSVKHISTH